MQGIPPRMDINNQSNMLPKIRIKWVQNLNLRSKTLLRQLQKWSLSKRMVMILLKLSTKTKILLQRLRPSNQSLKHWCRRCYYRDKAEIQMDSTPWWVKCMGRVQTMRSILLLPGGSSASRTLPSKGNKYSQITSPGLRNMGSLIAHLLAEAMW